jgi:hypothetical protein
MASNEEPLNCPFCRSTYVSVELGVVGHSYHGECGNCGAQGPSYEARKKLGGTWPRDAAGRAWNGDVYIDERDT